MDDKYREALDRERSLPTNSGAGKGSRPRKVDGQRYRDNWDRIFGKKKDDKDNDTED